MQLVLVQEGFFFLVKIDTWRITFLLVFVDIWSTCENLFCLKRLHRKEILSSFLLLLIQNILVVFFNFSNTIIRQSMDYSFTCEFCRLWFWSCIIGSSYSGDLLSLAEFFGERGTKLVLGKMWMDAWLWLAGPWGFLAVWCMVIAICCAGLCAVVFCLVYFDNKLLEAIILGHKGNNTAKHPKCLYCSVLLMTC